MAGKPTTKQNDVEGGSSSAINVSTNDSTIDDPSHNDNVQAVQKQQRGDHKLAIILSLILLASIVIGGIMVGNLVSRNSKENGDSEKNQTTQPVDVLNSSSEDDDASLANCPLVILEALRVCFPHDPCNRIVPPGQDESVCQIIVDAFGYSCEQWEEGSEVDDFNGMPSSCPWQVLYFMVVNDKFVTREHIQQRFSIAMIMCNAGWDWRQWDDSHNIDLHECDWDPYGFVTKQIVCDDEYKDVISITISENSITQIPPRLRFPKLQNLNASGINISGPLYFAFFAYPYQESEEDDPAGTSMTDRNGALDVPSNFDVSNNKLTGVIYLHNLLMHGGFTKLHFHNNNFDDITVDNRWPTSDLLPTQCFTEKDEPPISTRVDTITLYGNDQLTNKLTSAEYPDTMLFQRLCNSTILVGGGTQTNQPSNNNKMTIFVDNAESMQHICPCCVNPPHQVGNGGSSSDNFGLLIGAVVPGSLVLILLVVIAGDVIWRWRKKKEQENKSKNANNANDDVPVSSNDDEGHDDGSTAVTPSFDQ